jgi:hypothetical protein
MLGMVGHGDHSDRSFSKTRRDALECVTVLYDQFNQLDQFDQPDQLIEGLTKTTLTLHLDIDVSQLERADRPVISFKPPND